MRSHHLGKILTNILFLVFFVLIQMALAGCAEKEASYQVEVRNQLPVAAKISLDGRQDKSINAGGYEYFYGVEEGTHILRAEASGFEPIEEFIRVDRNIIWTIEER